MDTSAADAANAENKKLQGEMSGLAKELETAKLDLSIARQEIEKLEKAKKQMEEMLKAEQEQNKKLQALVRDIQKKLADQAQV